MESTSDIASMIVLAVVASMIVPVMGKGVRFLYSMLNMAIRMSGAILVAAVIVGLTRETAPMRFALGATRWAVSLVAGAAGLPQHITWGAPEVARDAIRDVVSRLMNYV